MIDNLKAQKEFKEYVKNYNPEDEKIKIKISHIERVSQVAKNIATNLKLATEDIQLAELIGLLHDIGRFEQIKQYDTFNDRLSINHGKYGVKVLFEDGLIRKFVEDDQYDEIIKQAILNHNTAGIKEGLPERQLLHSKIIRDADKIDIYYALIIGDKKAIWGKEDLSNDTIKDELYREFMEDRQINYNNVVGGTDDLLCHFAYVFDFNFKDSLKIIKDKKYIDLLYNRFKFKDEETMRKYNEIYKTVKEYMDSAN